MSFRKKIFFTIIFRVERLHVDSYTSVLRVLNVCHGMLRTQMQLLQLNQFSEAKW